MLLFRTLPRHLLRENLPKGSKTKPHSWTGLNLSDPMTQWRPFRGTRTTRRSKSLKHRWQWRSKLRPSPGLNVLYRFADPSKGDKSQMELVCSKFYSSQSRFVDQSPRYAVSSGKYLIRVRMHCYYCSSSKQAIFVPADKSVPSKPFGAIRTQQRRTEATTALDAVVMRSDLLDRMKIQLEAWIKSKGFECPELPKYRLRGYALSIWDYLTGRQHKQTILSNLPLGTPTIQGRGDLDKLR